MSLEKVRKIIDNTHEYWYYTHHLDHLFDQEKFIKDLRETAGLSPLKCHSWEHWIDKDENSEN